MSDALVKALRAARGHCRGRLYLIFGCGGDRDAGKRSVMGRVAAEMADRVVLTDDNPRTEAAAAIIADIRAGIEGDVEVLVIHDRAVAITQTLQAAAVDDVVLIAGKGHEQYQLVGTERRPFSDSAVVQQFIAALGSAA
jgi:UDP-N-acetylmuramoyl-L-alanyl-D-glutamate--2,6-diaminopimelate ligase